MRTINTAIRYGTTGTAGGRVFVVDVDFENNNAGNSDMTMQVQLHERSNTITVRYLDSQNEANGQTATIGFQGAGGGSATTVQPLTCNGKILDDNMNEEGWSADVGRAGLVTLSAMVQHSPDDIPGTFTTISGNNVASITLPFSVTIEGPATRRSRFPPTGGSSSAATPPAAPTPPTTACRRRYTRIRCSPRTGTT
jgi:hypothetical protein